MRFKEIPMNLQMFAGEEVPEVADPVLETEGAGNEDPEGMEGGGGNDPGVADPVVDQNAAFAAARRRAEQHYNQEIANRDAEYARRFGHLKNPETGQPIRNERDYFAALDAQERLNTQEQLRSQGVDPSVLERIIQNNPTIRQAEQVLRQATIEKGNQMLEDQIKEISGFYPEVKSLEDISKMETFRTFDRYVRSGMNLVDAFKLANYDSLVGRGAAASRQAAINSAKSTGHLIPVDGGANGPEGEVDIPKNELGLWQDIYPGLSYKELKAKYNRTL